MKRHTSIKRLVSTAAISMLLSSCASTVDQKCDNQLADLVERYQGAAIDTLVTLEVATARRLTDQERMSMMHQCQLLSAERMDSIMIITCLTNRIPCITESALVLTLRIVQPWSPDL